MSESTETTPQQTPNSGPEPGSLEDWGAPEPNEKRGPQLQPDPEPEDRSDEDNASVEGDDEPAKAAADDDDPIGDDPEDGEEADDGPEFWSKEDKAFWKQVPPELRPILRKYEQQRIEFANKKAEEAATERKRAMEEAQKAAGANEQYAKWWETNGPVFHKTFVDRWAGVDWGKLAEENPAEWARLSQMRANEHQMLVQANAQAETARTEAGKRAQTAEREARVAEHGKLAAKFPKEFGTPEASERSYKALAGFLAEQGIPAERISQTYEAPIVEIVRMAYKYKQLQAKAKVVTTPKPLAQSASSTPTRVVPGARNTSANPANEATRQAVERLRSGEHLTREDAGLAFR